MLANQLLALVALLVKICELCKEIDIKSMLFLFSDSMSELNSMSKSNYMSDSDCLFDLNANLLSRSLSKKTLFSLLSDTSDIWLLLELALVIWLPLSLRFLIVAKNLVDKLISKTAIGELGLIKLSPKKSPLDNCWLVLW